MNGLWKSGEGKYIAENLLKADGTVVAAITNADIEVTLTRDGVVTVLSSAKHALAQINSAAYLLTVTSGLVTGDGDAGLLIRPLPGVSAGMQFEPKALNFRVQAQDLDSLRAALAGEVAALSASLGGLTHTMSAAMQVKFAANPAAVWAYSTKTITGLTLSAVKNIFDTNKSQFSTLNSLGKLLVDNITASVSAVMAQCQTANAALTAIKGAGFGSGDSLVAIQSAVAGIPTGSLTYAKIVSAVLNATASSYQTAGTVGEILRFVKSYTTGRRYYNSTTGREEMYDGVLTLLKQFDITTDSDDRLIDRSPL